MCLCGESQGWREGEGERGRGRYYVACYMYVVGPPTLSFKYSIAILV